MTEKLEEMLRDTLQELSIPPRGCSSTSSYILYERKTKKSCIEQIYFQLFDFSTAYKIQQSTIAVFCNTFVINFAIEICNR